MHEALVIQIVDTCRRRAAEGDCPTVPAPSSGMLESAVIELAAERDKLLAAPEKPSQPVKNFPK